MKVFVLNLSNFQVCVVDIKGCKRLCSLLRGMCMFLSWTCMTVKVCVLNLEDYEGVCSGLEDCEGLCPEYRGL